jgi:hypothetical protein
MMWAVISDLLPTIIVQSVLYFHFVSILGMNKPKEAQVMMYVCPHGVAGLRIYFFGS